MTSIFIAGRPKNGKEVKKEISSKTIARAGELCNFAQPNERGGRDCLTNEDCKNKLGESCLKKNKDGMIAPIDEEHLNNIHYLQDLQEKSRFVKRP